MKKIVGGTSLLFFGLILYITSRIQAVNYLPNISSWPTDKGIYWSALNETHGLEPTYYGITSCIIGIILILLGCFEDQIIKAIKHLKNNRSEHLMKRADQIEINTRRIQ